VSRCWHPRCRRDPAVVLAGHGWMLHTCLTHEEVARAVTGIRPPRIPRQRTGEPALFDMGRK
jgi:hypothetical protein